MRENLLAVVNDSSEDLFDSFFFVLMRGFPTLRTRPAIIKLFKDNFEEYLRRARTVATSQDSMELERSVGLVLCEQHFRRLSNRKLTYTQSGRLGIVPPFAKPGDICCIVLGVSVPLILRHSQAGRYNLVGDSYIHGVMAGELLDQGNYEETEIILE